MAFFFYPPCSLWFVKDRVFDHSGDRMDGWTRNNSLPSAMEVLKMVIPKKRSAYCSTGWTCCAVRGKANSHSSSTVTQLMVARWRCRTQRVTDQHEDLKHWTEPEDKKSCDTSFNHRCWTCEERLHNICMHVNQNVRHLLMLHRGKAQFSNWMQTQNVWHCCAKMHDELNSDWITEKCCFI